MNLTVNKKLFLENVLSPSSKISDNLCLEFSELEGSVSRLKTIVTSADNTTILLADIPCEVKDSFKCVIPDCKTFLRLFSGIESDLLTLKVEDNTVLYKSSCFSFKYHLLDDLYSSSKKSISEEKIKQLQFDTTFEISRGKFAEILKFNSIVPDAEKLYFITEGSKVYTKLGDEQKANTNEITLEASDNFSGDRLTETLPLNIQSLLLLSFSTDIIKVSINQKLKIFLFETPNTKYVISGLVK